MTHDHSTFELPSEGQTAPLREPPPETSRARRGTRAPLAPSTSRETPPATSRDAVVGYAAAAPLYVAAGWTGVLPLRARSKNPPPDGFTGREAPDPDAAQVESWRETKPNGNVALRLPPDVVSIDVDAYAGKNGAETFTRLVEEHGPLPPTIKSTSRDPQHASGQLLFRLPPPLVGVPLRSNYGKNSHVDVIWHGYRYIAAWPSINPDSGGTRYRFYDQRRGLAALDGPPRIDDLPMLDADIHSGWLASLLKDRPATPPSPPEVAAGSPHQATAPPAEADAGRSRANALGGLRDEAAKVRAAGNGDREHTVNAAGLKLGHYVGGGWLTFAEVFDALVEAASATGWVEDENRARKSNTWAQDHIRRAIEDGMTEPDAGLPKEDQREAKRSAVATVIDHVSETYEVMQTERGEIFAVPKRGPRLPVMLGETGGRLRGEIVADLYEQSGSVVSGRAVDDALRAVIATAPRRAKVQQLDIRVAQRDGQIIVDLGQTGSASCVVVDANGWRVRNNPPKGVMFRRTKVTLPLPTPVAGGDLDALAGLLGFDVSDKRWLLVRGWLVASCLSDIARPLLAFVGQQGSAKTTRARMVLSVLDPRDELGSAFGKNIGDDQVAALNRYLVGWDNISSASQAVSDHLCRLVTGEAADGRMLYTNDELATISYRRTGALTALAIPPLRPDALERLIPVVCDRMPKDQRRSELAIREEFAACHAEVLGGLLDAVSKMLGNLESARARDASRERMADFHDALFAFDPATAAAFGRSVREAMVEAAESDPFVAAITHWLDGHDLPLELRPEQAWERAQTHLGSIDGARRQPWWPASPASFSTSLIRAAEPLRAVGIEVTRHRHKEAKRQIRTLIFSAVPDDQPGLFEEPEGDRS